MNLSEVVNHFLIDCEIRGLTEETIKWYRRRLTSFIKRLEKVSKVTELELVKIAHLRQVVQVLMAANSNQNNPTKPLSAFTIRGYVRAIKVFLSWCYTEELIANNPSTRLVQPKAPDYLIPTFTTEHIEKMLASCDNTTPGGFRNYVLVLVLLDTGMRASELCGLQVSDIHDRYVKVLGKGRKEREIGLHPEVSKLLWKYVHKYRKPTDSNETTLFIGRRGEPLRYFGVSSMLKEVRKASGIEGVRVSAHTFRHTFAKFYLERGGEVFKLSREMGHSTIQITEIYLKDYHSSEARKEHNTYSPIGEIGSLSKKRQRKPKDVKGVETEE